MGHAPPMPIPDAFAVLGLSQDDLRAVLQGAGGEAEAAVRLQEWKDGALKDAHREAVRRLHPDATGTDTNAEMAAANVARDVLLHLQVIARRAPPPMQSDADLLDQLQRAFGGRVGTVRIWNSWASTTTTTA